MYFAWKTRFWQLRLQKLELSCNPHATWPYSGLCQILQHVKWNRWATACQNSTPHQVVCGSSSGVYFDITLGNARASPSTEALHGYIWSQPPRWARALTGVFRECSAKMTQAFNTTQSEDCDTRLSGGHSPSFLLFLSFFLSWVSERSRSLPRNGRPRAVGIRATFRLVADVLFDAAARRARRAHGKWRQMTWGENVQLGEI